MKSPWKAALLGGAAWTILAGAAAAQDVVPPQAGREEPAEGVVQQINEAQQEDTDVGEVVVTARRREESLQDVPIAVSAFTEERLDQLGARDITALQQTTPNLTLQVARGSNSTIISFIRGVGQQDPLWGFEPGVGLYIDDVYIARPQGAVLDIFDISRIEVLRGPQGTLYGRNTIGGAIKYVTDRISAEPEIRLRVNVGSYNQADLIVSGERRLNDQWAISGALATFNRDGYGENRFTGAEHYNRETIAGRATIEYAPTDQLFFRVSVDRIEDDSNPRHGHREVATATEPVLDDVYDTRAGAGDRNRVELGGVSLLAQYELNDQITFKSITANRGGQTFGPIDFDNTPAPTLDIPAAYSDSQFSQEFQILYEGERVQGVAGYYFLDAYAAGAFDTVLGLAGLTTLTQGQTDTTSHAVFADVSFNVTDQLQFSIGGRFTRDERSVVQFRQNYLGIRSPRFGNVRAPALGAPRSNYTNSREFEEFTPRLGVRYEFNDDLTVYASYGRGFKSGGFDMRGDVVSFPGTVNGYEPEFVDTYEIGVKGRLFDRRLSYAAAIFDSSYEGQQITSQFLLPPTTIVSFVDNAGSSSIRGAELEGSFRWTDELISRFTLGYIDAQFEEFITFNPATGRRENLAGVRGFQNTPDLNAFIDLTYTRDLGPGYGSFSFTPSASYRGAYQLFEVANANLDQDAYWLYDATLIYTLPNDRYRFILSGRNLSDEEYVIGGYNFPAAITGTSVIGFYGPPRTFTLSFDARF